MSVNGALRFCIQGPKMTEHIRSLTIVSPGQCVKLKETEEGKQIKHNPFCLNKLLGFIDFSSL